MQRYLYAFPIGFALGIPENDITRLLEVHTTMEEVASALGKLANKRCQSSYPVQFKFNDHIVHDLVIALLTNKTIVRS